MNFMDLYWLVQTIFRKFLGTLKAEGCTVISLNEMLDEYSRFTIWGDQQAAYRPTRHPRSLDLILQRADRDDLTWRIFARLRVYLIEDKSYRSGI